MNFDFRSDVKSDGIQEQSPFCNSSWFNKEKDGSDSMCDKDVALAHPTLARMKKERTRKKKSAPKAQKKRRLRDFTTRPWLARSHGRRSLNLAQLWHRACPESPHCRVRVA